MPATDAFKPPDQIHNLTSNQTSKPNQILVMLLRRHLKSDQTKPYLGFIPNQTEPDLGFIPNQTIKRSEATYQIEPNDASKPRKKLLFHWGRGWRKNRKYGGLILC